MNDLLLKFIITLITGMSDGGFMFEGMADIVFRTEDSLSVNGVGNLLDSLMAVTMSFGIGMIMCKFLKKGFETYVLWTDGDPDAEPLQLLTNFFKAMAVALCFPTLYDLLVQAAEELNEQVMGVFGNPFYMMSGIATKVEYTDHLLGAIGLLVFIICWIILYFGFIAKGLEMFILRLGVPLACIGLVDADQGIFRNYIMMFFKCATTVIVQLFLVKLGLSLCYDSHLIWGIAAMFAAIRMPKFISEFLVPSGGGSVSNVIYTSVRMASMVKGMVK